jgi:hypothetical protein
LGVGVRDVLPRRRVDLREADVSIHPLTLVERLDLLVCMTSIALSFGLFVLISAQKGDSGRAWVWALAFVATSLLTDLLFWRLT